jgi:dTMP kinase
MSGIFISFEGIDGAGKSTHINALAAAFRAQGRVVTLTREPGGTPLAEQLRCMVLNDAMDAMTEALLVFAARRDHIVQVIRPALARDEVVLCDRFTDATFAYQGGGRSFDWDVLSALENWVQEGVKVDAQGGQGSEALLQPSFTIWFDLPPAVAAVRLAGARVPDKFEAQPESFFEKVVTGYARRYAANPARFARIDADQTPEQVWSDVLAAVRQKGLLP